MKDKIIFWLDTGLLTFGISKYLQEKHQCEKYAIIDVPDRRKSFFEKQKIVTFEKIWFYHDHIKIKNKKPDIKYLEYIEKEYKINLWLLAINERIFYNNEYYKFKREEILSILEQECRLFEEILNEVKPDFLIIITNLHHNHLFHEMCKVRNVKTLVLSSARLASRCMILQDVNRLDFKPTFNESVTIRDFDELQNYLKKNSMWDQTTIISKSANKSKSSLLKTALHFLFVYKNTSIKNNYTYFGRTKLKVLFYSIIDSIRIKRRTNFMNKHFIKITSLLYDF